MQLAVLQIVERHAQCLAHGRPIGDGVTHILQDCAESGGDRLATGGVVLLADLDMHQRFAQRAGTIAARRFEQFDDVALVVAAQLQDGMDDEVDDEVDPIERRGHRVDEKRHVVIDDLDDRAARAPAVLGRPRVEDADLGIPRLALLGEVPQRGRGTIEILGVTRQDVIGRNMGVELANDLRQSCCLPRIESPDDETGNRLDERALALFTLPLHPSSLRHPVLRRNRFADPAWQARAYGNPIDAFGKLSKDDRQHD